MDIQVQELIDKIRQDGIESASDSARKIREEAQADAKKTVEAARKEAESLLEKAKADVVKMEASSREALEQASRNCLIALRSRLEAVFAAVTVRETGTAMSADLIAKVLPELLSKWSATNSEAPDLLLPEAAMNDMEKALRAALSAELSKGLVIRPVKNLDAGFRLAAKEGGLWWDYSAEALGEVLAAYLNPRLAETVRSAVEGL